jgi:hypothetical protein
VSAPRWVPMIDGKRITHDALPVYAVSPGDPAAAEQEASDTLACLRDVIGDAAVDSLDPNESLEYVLITE